MLRQLTQADLPQILVIENTVHIVPWTEETFRVCFQSGYQGWVIEQAQQIVGFIIVSSRIEECHILNIGVARHHQHQGNGRKLMNHAIAAAKKQGIPLIYLEVRRSNSRAIALYKSMQFELVGERRNYYPTLSGQEDALIFVKSLLDDLPVSPKLKTHGM